MSDDENKFALDTNSDHFILPDGELLSCEQMEERLAADIQTSATPQEKDKARFLYALFLMETAKPLEALDIFLEIHATTEDDERKEKCRNIINHLAGDNPEIVDGHINIDDEDLYFRMTQHYCATRSFLTARSYFKESLTIISDPGKKASLHLMIGGLCEQNGNFQAAIDYYSSAFSLPRGSDERWYFLNNNLGYSLNQEKQFAEAEAYCREAIRIDPKKHNAHKNLGLSLQGQGKIPEAVRAFVSSVQRYPIDPRAFDHLKELIENTPDIEEKVPDLNAHLWECHKAIAIAGRNFTGPNDPKLMTIPPFPPNVEEQEWIDNSPDPKVAYFAFRFALAYNTLSPEYLWGLISKDAEYERPTPSGTLKVQGGERIFDRWARIIYRMRDNPDQGRALLELGTTQDDHAPGILFYASHSDIQQGWMDPTSIFMRFQCNPAGRMTRGSSVFVDPPQKLPEHSGLFPGLKSGKIKSVPISFINGRGIRFILFSSDGDEVDISGNIAADHVIEVVSRLEGSIFVRINIKDYDENKAWEDKIHPDYYDIREYPSVIILSEDKILFIINGLDRIKNLQNEIGKVFPLGRGH